MNVRYDCDFEYSPAEAATWSLSLLQSKASEQTGRVTTQRQPQLKLVQITELHRQPSTWRDFRSTYAHYFLPPKNLWHFFETLLVSTKAQIDIMWTELAWVFIKGRSLKHILRKTWKQITFFSHTFSHIYWLCDHFQKIILKCQLSLGPSLTFKPQPLSLSLMCTFTVVVFLPVLDEKLMPTAILIPAVCQPGAFLTTQHTDFLSLWLFSPKDTSTVKPILAISSISSHCQFCQPSDANLVFLLLLLTFFFTLLVFWMKALFMNSPMQQTFLEDLTYARCCYCCCC